MEGDCPVTPPRPSIQSSQAASLHQLRHYCSWPAACSSAPAGHRAGHARSCCVLLPPAPPCAMRLAALPACSSSRGHAAATQRGAAAAAWPQRARTSKQQRLGRVRVLSNTEQLQDSWSPQARAAVLGLKLEAWDALLPVAPLLASCDPSGLFVLKEVAGLLELSVADAVALAAQVPALLRTPSLQVEAHIAVLQRQLFLGRPDAVQLLRSDAALVALSTRALEGAAVRLAKGCGISSPGGFATLGWLCSRCEGMALSDVGGTQQRVDALARAMGVSAATALDVLRVEAALFGDADELLEAPGNVAAAWAGLAKQLGLPAKELAAEVVQQLLGSEPRYSLRATQQLQADVAALAEMSSLPAPVLLRMLLAAPGLNAVPRSFWRVLFQYVLLLMPHWRDELDELDQRQAGRLVVELCAGSASSDVISVEPADDAFATADVDYNRQVMVLNALLDQGVMAPVFETRDSIRAGKLWRLVYLCNPRHQAAAAVAAARRAAYNKAKRQQAGSKPGSNGKTGGLWTWAALLPLPAPLLQQLQDSGALACDLPAAANSSSGSGSGGGGAAPGTAAGAAPAGEEVEDLLEVVRLSTSAFCARHPGYAHWLSVTAFELEWSNSRAAAPVSTWDAGSYARSAGGGGASW